MAKTIAHPTVKFGGSIGGLVGQIDRLQGRLSSFASRTTSIGSKFLDLGSKLGMIAVGVQSAAAVIGKAISPLTAGFNLANQLEQDLIALETMIGSAAGAQLHLDNLKRFAASTPFELPGLIDASKVLLAFGFTAEEQIPLLTRLGNVAAGTGSNVSELGKIFGQISAEGKLTTERFNQLVERGVPIGPALAKTMGIAESGLRDAMRQGKITAEVFRQSFEGMADAEFGGLMDKQSQSIAGRLSSLRDNVSLTMADLVSRVMNAVGFGGALDKAASLIATFGPRVVTIVGNVADRVMAVAAATWNTIQPFIASAWNWMTSIFADRVRTLLGLAFSIWNGINAVMNGIWSVVSRLWDATLGRWLGSMNTLTGSTEAMMGTVGTIFGWLSDTAAWVLEKITLGLNVLAFAVNNVGAIFDLLGTSIAYNVAKIGNEIHYTFAEVIPALLTWFGENWQDVFLTIADLTATVFKNIGGNIVSVLSNLPGLISGATDWGDIWTPLTDGFESSIRELPEIAARQAGEIEQALADSLSQQRGDLREGLAEYLAEQRANVDGAIIGLAGLAKDTPKVEVEIPTPQVPNLPEFVTPEVPVAATEPEEKQKATDESGGASAQQQTSLIEAFSAENLARTFGQSLSLASPDATTVADKAADAAMPKPPKDEQEQTKLTRTLVDSTKEQTRALLEFVRSWSQPQTIVSIG